ncbi:MAG: oxygen-dependent coproporphyrinogen oxidase [Alphaproteobacteria bacterium]|nr:oxygen-dependent coproporphyrinogen oxidase [Alphaproteobacteria bacterium]
MTESLDAVRRRFDAGVRALQDRIVDAVRALDPALEVREDLWERTDAAGEPGGGGRTRALSGEVVESGGVNTSCVWGAVDPAFVAQLGGQEGDRLWAAGISLILHPRNPRVPTTHANFRMIGLGGRTWFGGGADLTPYHPHLDDFRHFHRTWQEACAPLGTYAAWKAWCDRYFTNHHRDGEMRGIGGVFFDGWGGDHPAASADAVLRLGDAFLPSWIPLAARRKDEPYTEAEEDFMLHRRGRYVEFNLLHDRGTAFGLRTGGRTESILVSLPARVRFGYRWAPPEGTPQAEMMALYRPREWVG